MKRFAGKVVLITGAGRGQGRTHAVGFAREGADLAICDLPAGGDPGAMPYARATDDDLSETARLVEAEGRRVVAERLDVRDYAAVQEFAARTIVELGSIDVLIANAGIISFAPLTELTEGQFDATFDVNVKGVWHAIKAVVPHMRERGDGRVVISGSVGSLVGAPNVGHYVASKHALVGMAKSLAHEVGRDGVTVNVVCPTGVRGPMLQNPTAYAAANPADASDEGTQEARSRLNALGVPWLEPEDVTGLVLFLASDDARRMTGGAVALDMGYTAV